MVGQELGTTGLGRGGLKCCLETNNEITWKRLSFQLDVSVQGVNGFAVRPGHVYSAVSCESYIIETTLPRFRLNPICVGILPRLEA